MKLGILILHFNTPELTKRLADSIQEAIVIDNGSDKGKEFKGKNRSFKTVKPLGFTKGWNTAIDGVYKEFDAFWLMNSDIEVTRQSIDRVKEVLKRKDIEMFTPSYNAWNRSSHNQGTGNLRETGFMEFCAPVIKKSVFERVGFFDETFALGYGVELDFIYRAKQKGIKVWVDDGSEFYHIGHQTIGGNGGLLDYQAKGNAERDRAMKKKYGTERPPQVYDIEALMDSDFRKRAFVYTEIFGDYDDLKPVKPQNIPVPFVCVTDNPNLNGEGWKIVVVNFPRKDLHMNLQAKWFKMFPWTIPGFEDYEISIHIDGATTITKDSFVEHAMRLLDKDFVLFKHPDRNNIRDELKISMTFQKYHYENTAAQVQHYLNKGFPGGPLYACTCLVRRHTENIKQLMQQWYLECMQWSYQDQLSLPYLLWKNKFEPVTFKENLWRNEYINANGHQHKGDLRAKETGVKVKHRNEIINHIINRMGYKSYLEIGHETGVSFYGINCELKESIDVRITQGHKPTYLMRSDDFFAKHPKKRYDVIFVDGDHERMQVVRDVENSLKALNPGGCIIMHDTNPPNKEYTKQGLCFTAYRAVVDLQFADNDLEIYTLTLPEDQGNGISVIFRGKKTFKRPKIDHAKFMLYEYWHKNREEITGGITFPAFDRVLDSKAPIQKKREHTLAVLMPAFNSPVEEIRAAVNSILNQTEKPDQFIIVDDGSVTLPFARYMKELARVPGITIIRSRTNNGVAAALNLGLEHCKTDLVLRMDADDIARPNLIQKQHDYMEAHPEAVICGVQIQCFGGADWQSNHPAIVTPQMLYDNAKGGWWMLNHPGACFRREIIERYGNYGNTPKGFPEDYALWCRLARAGYSLHNMPDVLIDYRYVAKPERQLAPWNDFRERCRKSIMPNTVRV